jgi:hypothetical protein
MSRHKRLREIVDIPRFVVEATAMHETVISYLRKLETNGLHYRTLSDLHDALLKAIRDVTGEEVPWMRTPPDNLPAPSWRAR